MTMYRARVDAVSGLHVRAGGKWLTCIGNRVVRAGDLVWTDGRCVYGHDRESQTPLVIAPKEEPAVPICSKDGSLVTFAEFRRGRLCSSKSISWDYTSSSWSDIVDAHGNASFCLSNNRGKSLISVKPVSPRYSYDYHQYISGKAALNIDSAGNVYEIIDNYSAPYQIVKNGNVIENLEEIRGLNEDFVPPETGGGSFTIVFLKRSDIMSSFIENENNWWICYLAVTNYYSVLGTKFWQSSLTIINPSGRQRLFTCRPTGVTLDRETKVPMHDGFYFKIQNATTKFKSSSSDDYFQISVELTIFSPQDVALITLCPSENISDYGALNRFYFAGCQLKPNKFLISSMQDGLFICDGKNHEQIFDGKITNQCLRPMKHCRNWWERVQTLD